MPNICFHWMKLENENLDAAKKGLILYGKPQKATLRNSQRKSFDSDKHLKIFDYNMARYLVSKVYMS